MLTLLEVASAGPRSSIIANTVTDQCIPHGKGRGVYGVIIERVGGVRKKEMIGGALC